MNKTARVLFLSVLSGMLYGLVSRFTFGFSGLSGFMEIMSGAFIFGVPIALGFISVFVGTSDFRRKETKHFESSIFLLSLVLPWPAGLAFLFGTLILMWEGLICIILWLPLVLILSSVGGFFGGLVRIYIESKRTYHSCVAVVAIAPFLVAPAEQLRDKATEVREVHSSIQIEASAEEVWEQIRSVPTITESEHKPAIIHALGFPRPLAAELVGEGIGSVRNATFEGNVLFIEKVTEWEPNKRIAFTIDADTDNIPPDTFDEHVTIGGPYFDVLDGRYEIEELDEQSVMLHLHSTQRISTGFNFYAHLWTTWLMDELQTYILEIIKVRAERVTVKS